MSDMNISGMLNMYQITKLESDYIYYWKVMLIRHTGKHFMLDLSPAFHSVTSRKTEYAQRG